MKTLSRNFATNVNESDIRLAKKLTITSLERGFTLIELLVVIALIGLLASIILASLNNGRYKSRDAKRLEDMRSFQNALELYHATTGHYPYSCSGALGVWSSFDSGAYAPKQLCSTPNGSIQIGTLSQVLAPYISPLADPKNIGGDAGYLYQDTYGADDYCVLVWRTPENMDDFPTGYVDNYSGRCGTVTNGQCSSGHNAVFVGMGKYATVGC
ncbi:MAG: prepilin-type N-terminal cleavage/methylation domain-containing protein [Candidatus Pacebacteria bacterium]|nr:prepilin-type N-terminal cleavage/methylation domain-containing protein [Candidatus Paceibacterota bacterium]